MDKKIILLILFVIVLLVLMYIYKGNIITIQQSPEGDINQSELADQVNQVEVETYTLNDLAGHATENDCWLVVDGKVYDVTEFIPLHPGGKAILKGCGSDASVLFNTRPTNLNTPHPESAYEKLNDYYIGDLK